VEEAEDLVTEGISTVLTLSIVPLSGLSKTAARRVDMMRRRGRTVENESNVVDIHIWMHVRDGRVKVNV